jgi:hypothetical protein
MFREYYISSMKIEYRPCHIDAGNQNGFIMNALICGTSVDEYSAQGFSATNLLFRNSLDAKSYDPMKPFKRFYRVYKYAKSKSLVWRSTADAITGANGGFAGLPNSITNISMPCTGLAPGA